MKDAYESANHLLEPLTPREPEILAHLDAEYL